MISRLLPYLFSTHRTPMPQATACDSSCKKCNPTAPCGHLPVSDDFPFEADKSALGTQQDKWLSSPSTFLDRLCSLDPSAPECRIYED